jgi:hypothetical protein
MCFDELNNQANVHLLWKFPSWEGPGVGANFKEQFERVTVGLVLTDSRHQVGNF